ncbi:hypothetical protein J5N97_022626 [Dioscorea zingiberensis]|uniref:Uncharacterized protein n=1 Tax=Dioscorea zingiberensis TaxID=325984 RepID=A0A9D5CB52_9LILI|nr:hypothetical protein J5N97_022626 [Dioscorea zingiberensis]
MVEGEKIFLQHMNKFIQLECLVLLPTSHLGLITIKVLATCTNARWQNRLGFSAQAIEKRADVKLYHLQFASIARKRGQGLMIPDVFVTYGDGPRDCFQPVSSFLSTELKEDGYDEEVLKNDGTLALATENVNGNLADDARVGAMDVKKVSGMGDANVGHAGKVLTRERLNLGFLF